MKKSLWIAGGFAAGMLVAAATARPEAQAPLLPEWVIRGVCFDTTNSGKYSGIEFVLEIQGTWVKTSQSGDGFEHWRNLGQASELRRLSDETCRVYTKP